MTNDSDNEKSKLHTKLIRLLLAALVTYWLATSGVLQEIYSNLDLDLLVSGPFYFPQGFVDGLPIYLVPLALMIIRDVIRAYLDNGKGSIGRFLRNAFTFIVIAACMIPIAHGIDYIRYGIPPDVKEWVE